MSTCHVLDFFHDSSASSALTVRVNGVRFHIIADIDRLKEDSNISSEYTRLLGVLRDEKEGHDEDKIALHNSDSQSIDSGADDEEDGKEVFCVCRKPDTGSFMLGCDSECGNWFHGKCVGITEEEGKSIDRYICSECQARKRKSVTRAESVEGEEDRDSGVDVSSNMSTPRKDRAGSTTAQDSPSTTKKEEAEENQNDPETELQNWILAPFAADFARLAPVEKQLQNVTINEWYNPQTHFFELECKNGKLSPTELESAIDLQQRMEKLTPRLAMPKYILNLDIPWIDAHDLHVVEESEELGPVHPAIVRDSDGSMYFLKIVDPTQPAPTKREIKTMKQVEKLGLRKQIRIPRVLGLIGFKDSKTEILGFLQSHIESPTPLTKLLDSKIPQGKRDRWAKESEEIVNILHKHDIIWGDAKADNFMVDVREDLWIIDFGGSYTDGWVDPELMETEEGDDMGVEKIVGALDDPGANTFEPEDNEVKSGGSRSLAPDCKRKRGPSTSNNMANTSGRPSKQIRQSH